MDESISMSLLAKQFAGRRVGQLELFGYAVDITPSIDVNFDGHHLDGG